MIEDLPVINCEQTLRSNYIGRLAYVYDNKPYVVPTTFFYDALDKSILCFASFGHRVQAMRNQKQVSLQVDDVLSLEQWKSVLVQGTYQELMGGVASRVLKRYATGVKETIDRKKQNCPKFIDHFSKVNIEAEMPIVYRVRITGITGKVKQGKSSF